MTVGSVAAETVDHRRHRARRLSAFFAAGALMSTVILALPGWDGLHRSGIAATVVLAGLGAGILRVWGGRVGRVWCHAFTTAGTLLIAACQVLAGGGSATASYALLYVWVALHTALFFGRGAVLAHVAATTLAHAGALALVGDATGMGPALALTLGTQTAAAMVVGSLAAQLRRQADTDPLTGLGNRRVATRMLEHALRRRTRGGHVGRICVALLDLDGFKAFNDRRGHLAGDALLVEAARRWAETLGDHGVLSRTGGDEFTLLLPERTPEEAAAIVDELVAGTPGGVSCSAGLACWDGRESAADLLARADRAMYDAKRDGPMVEHELPKLRTGVRFP